MSTLKAARADNMVRSGGEGHGRHAASHGEWTAPTPPYLPLSSTTRPTTTRPKGERQRTCEREREREGKGLTFSLFTIISLTPPPPPHFRRSLNKQQGTHALRGRASRLASHGILTVRFELPFPVWCGRCGHLMGKGVRFNADKRAAGTYHTTTVWRFEMATPCCSNRLIMRADPAARDFVVEDGGARKVVRDAGMEASVGGDDSSGGAVFASLS